MRKTVLSVAAGAALLLAANAASAMCIYNQSEFDTVYVEFDCGFLCSNKWEIRKGQHNCRGGKGGELEIGIRKGGYYLRPWVQDHGYVTVHGNCRQMTARVWSESHVLFQEVSAHSLKCN